MKRWLPLAVLPLLVLAVARLLAAPDAQGFDRIERGRYLTVLGDCAACHTTPGGRPFAGGLPLRTPFGTLLAPNITPDQETGIGRWTDAEFVSLLREGRGHDGRRIYPAMPYPAYTKLTDDDALDIRAYLRTVEPVSHKVVANQLPFPFSIRLNMVVWNAVNFKYGAFQPDPRKSAEWNRGAFIVEGPGHCGTCHTPKNIMGGDKASSPLQGAVLQGWYAPDLTPDRRKGIGSWSHGDIAEYLKTGSNRWSLSAGPMAEVVTHSTSQMTDRDLGAIATYLKDGNRAAAAAGPAPLAPGDDRMRVGGAIYKDGCAACHRDDGMGQPRLFPRLAGNPSIQSDDATSLVHVVLAGARAVGTRTRPTAPAMPAFGWRLDDAQVAAVVTYIRNSWGNAAAAVPARQVARQRRGLKNTP